MRPELARSVLRFAQWVMQGTLGLANGLPMVISPR